MLVKISITEETEIYKIKKESLGCEGGSVGGSRTFKHVYRCLNNM